MASKLKLILDWSEVWALLIPIVALYIYKPVKSWIKPIKTYLWLAFVINLIGNFIWMRKKLGAENWLKENVSFFYDSDGSFDNTLLYNLHSIARFLLFIWFFHFMGKVFMKMNRIFPALFLLITAIIFTFYRDIRDFSSILLAMEAAFLLTYCLIYYFMMLRDENTPAVRPAHFWFVTGLSIYVVINFPIFLFYTALAEQAKKFAMNLWDVHNISYIVFCIFIAKAFYAARKQ